MNEIDTRKRQKQDHRSRQDLNKVIPTQIRRQLINDRWKEEAKTESSFKTNLSSKQSYSWMLYVHKP